MGTGVAVLDLDLDGLKPVELPIDRPRLYQPILHPLRHEHHLPRYTLSRLTAIALHDDLTVEDLLAAIWWTLIYRYSGERDLNMAVATSEADLIALVSCQINPLRHTSECAHAIREHTRQAVSDAATLTLESWLNTPRDKRPRTLLTVHKDIAWEITPFELSCFLSEIYGESPKLIMTYDSALFDAPTIARMGDHFVNLLNAVAARPTRAIAYLPLQDTRERRQLLASWGRAGSTPRRQHVHERIQAKAQLHPDTVAVVDQNCSLSYRHLDQRAEHLAAALQTRGVRPEVRVGVRLSRTADLVVALLGVLKAGGVYVPLDPAYPIQRQQLMADDAQLEHLISEVDATPLENHAEFLTVDTLIAQKHRFKPIVPSSENLAYVLYTSGSTGKPKGVQITHGALMNFLIAMTQKPGFAQTDRLLAVTSLSFDIAALELFLPLVNGGRLILADRPTVSDGKRLRQAIRETGATIVQATPVTWRLLIQAGWQGAHRIKILCGGEAMTPDLAHALLDRSEQVWNLYGPTETTIWSTAALTDDADDITIGQPIDHTQVYVLDAHGQLAVQGMPGQLFIGGHGVARGYLGRPELTAERFIPDAFSQESGLRLYCTGDRVRYLPDGRLIYMGRIDHQVKIRGHRIEPGEIEYALEDHPLVVTAVVMVRKVADEMRLAAYVQPLPQDPDPNDEAALEQGRNRWEPDTLTQELKQHLRNRFPEFMVPAHLMLIHALPTTPNGKIDRKALSAKPLDEATTQPQEERANQVEELLIGIWEKVLGVRPVRPSDNFFELGGHSLLAARIADHVDNLFQVALPFHQLMQHDTIRDLAAFILQSRRHEGELPELRHHPVEPGLNPILSSGEARLFSMILKDPHNPCYNFAAVLRLHGELDLTALHRAVGEVIDQHHILRTRYLMQEQGAVTELVPTPAQFLQLADLSSLPAKERAAQEQRLIDQALNQAFDLAKPPLIRLILMRQRRRDWRLLVVFHHIVADGWSVDVFFEALAKAYADEPAAADQVQYRDYARTQQTWLNNNALVRQQIYWRDQLSDLEHQRLPGGSEQMISSDMTADAIEQTLSRSLSAKLRHFSQEQGATTFMTLLGVLKLLLYRHTEQTDLVIGVPVANRNREALTRVIGFFASPLAVRTKFDGAPDFRDLLARVRCSVLALLQHQDIPIGMILEQLEGDWDMNLNPFFRVMFNYVNQPPAPNFPELLTRVQELPETAVKWPLLLHAFDFRKPVTDDPEDQGGQIHLKLVYQRARYTHDQASELMQQYQRLLYEIIEHPNQPLHWFALEK